MLTKDYYKILDLQPYATIPEIKQAYRKLAMTWHPDKNQNDSYAKAKFHEVKEAYEVLTNPLKKEVYLQQRWYDQSIGKKRTAVTITPVNILKLALDLERYVSSLDPHRMNKEGLREYINELLSDSTIEKLKDFNEADVNRQTIVTILSALKLLPPRFTEKLIHRLKYLAGDDEKALYRIDEFRKNQKKKFLWNKYKILVLVVITVLICLLIFLISK